MDISTVKTVGTQLLGRGLLVGRKYSPEILTAVGIVGFITSSVMASKSTLKVEKTLDEGKFEIDMIREQKELQGDKYPDIHYKKDLTRAYVGLTVDLARLYGPAVTLTLGSTACVIGAHGIMQKRNVALVAAYKTIETAFGEYRKRVVEDLGVNKDREYRYGTRTDEVEKKNGEKEQVILYGDEREPSGYARYFRDDNPNWANTPEFNMFFLKQQQNWLNDVLHSRGHVFLNEVYDRLDIPRSQAGAVVGWAVTTDDTGDNFIDFGLDFFDLQVAERNFVSGRKPSILLDFNVNGVIFNLLKG